MYSMKSWQLLSQSRSFLLLWKPKSLFLHSQMLSIWPYTEALKSSPLLHTHFSKIHFTITFLAIQSPKWSLPLRFHNKNTRWISCFTIKKCSKSYWKILHIFRSPTCAIWPIHLIFLDLIILTVLGEEHKHKFTEFHYLQEREGIHLQQLLQQIALEMDWIWAWLSLLHSAVLTCGLTATKHQHHH